MMPINRRLNLVAWLLASLFLTACGEPEEAKEVVSRPVKLFVVGAGESDQTRQFPGSVAAVQRADMAFEVSGRITEMAVDEGELVEAGDVLARVDPRAYEAERDRVRAEYNAAQVEYSRYEKAFRKQAVTEQQRDRARSDMEIAEANLRRAEKAVEDTVMRAPFTGRVARKLVEDFANVQAKQPVLILQDDDALEMQVDVPESIWVARTKGVDPVMDDDLNSRLSVVLSALPDISMPARVTSFANMADPMTRTFEVTVGFELPEGVSASPGATGHVAYELPSEFTGGGLTIPADAVVASPDNTPYVWLYDAESGTVVRRDVRVAELTGDSIRVVSGLSRGDRIAASGVHSLSDGFPVHAWEE